MWLWRHFEAQAGSNRRMLLEKSHKLDRSAGLHAYVQFSIFAEIIWAAQETPAEVYKTW